MRAGGYREPPKWRSHGLADRRFASAGRWTLTRGRWRLVRRAPVQLRHNKATEAVRWMAICRRVRDRVLVAVPLIAHTLAFERVIRGRRNLQFLVSNIASNPVPKHLDIHLRWCSNRSFRTHCSFPGEDRPAQSLRRPAQSIRVTRSSRSHSDYVR